MVLVCVFTCRPSKFGCFDDENSKTWREEVNEIIFCEGRLRIRKLFIDFNLLFVIIGAYFADCCLYSLKHNSSCCKVCLDKYFLREVIKK